jgi:hypothetical protein
MRQAEFKLQFPPKRIRQYAEQYTFEDDTKALVAGQRISRGECTGANLQIIFEWKSKGRGRSRIRNNSESDIAEALRIAATAEGERAAISVLLGLNGVDVPVASAILTAINPQKYTIIDFRALKSLGADTPDRSVNYYLQYLSVCREIAQRFGVTLRELDRALWQWSWEKDRLPK